MTASAKDAQFILASASPRRLALLEQVGLEPDEVVPARITETRLSAEPPRDMAARLARDKAQAVARRRGGCFVLGADTVVAAGRRVVPKARTAQEARQCLRLLSGRRHRVFGGICLIAPDGGNSAALVSTLVSFKRLGEAEMEHYLSSGEWQGKAGGYAIQGLAAAFIRWINGSYSNVVGLSLFETVSLLAGAGYGPAGKMR